MRGMITGIAILLLSAVPAQAGGKFAVVTTTPDLAAIARAITGEAGTVYSIARPDQDPHYVQAKPSHMVKIRRADAVVYNGLDLEIGWLPKLLEGSRNPSVMAGRPGNLDASRAIDHEQLLEVPTGEVDRSEGDIHPEGNPHYLLDPKNGIRVASWMATALGGLEPDHAALFQANAETFTSAVEKLITDWEKRIELLDGLKIIAYHKQWEYLVDWLGLDIAAYIEDRPGIPPSPRHILGLERLIGSGEIAFIIKAHYVASHAPESMAEKTGIRMVSLPATVTGSAGVDTYQGMILHILQQLIVAKG